MHAYAHICVYTVYAYARVQRNHIYFYFNTKREYDL